MHPQKNNNLNTENCDTEDGWLSVVGTLGLHDRVLLSGSQA